MRDLSSFDTSRLTDDERAALTADVQSIVNDERRTWEDALRVLLSRIGGNDNLRPYVDTLMVAWRRSNELSIEDATINELMEERDKLRADLDEAAALLTAMRDVMLADPGKHLRSLPALYLDRTGAFLSRLSARQKGGE